MRANTNFARMAAGLLGGAVLAAVAGCGSGTKFDYAEVEGKVTLDGMPLSGVKVVFYPDSEGAVQLPYATGMTDGAGKYTLTAVTSNPGALVGKNRVVVNWPPQERNDDLGKRPPPPSPPIPLKYTVVTESPLVVEVKAGPQQTIDLPLQK